MKRIFFTIFCAIGIYTGLFSQAPDDAWMYGQLGTVTWQQTYEGVLADYHPVTIKLASDNKHITGYLIHKGDNRVHRLMGDWSKKDLFQLQERDEFDRLTGYLSGSITGDQVHMEWMSADQSRMFDITAYQANLIRIKSFKPIAEGIHIDADQDIIFSVQKMEYGIVSGVANRNGVFTRFEGYCLDGTCSIWNTVLQNDGAAPTRIQMRQRDAKTYRAVIDSKEFPAAITYTIPLAVKAFDNSMGFLDFVYPVFESESYALWMQKWIDKVWNDGVNHLTAINQPGSSARLVHRSSGWIEILEESEMFMSGLITYINPGSVRRESFVWLKKEDVFMTGNDFLNSPEDLKKVAALTLDQSQPAADAEYMNWLRGAGYSYLLPGMAGIVMLTEFNMIYGDDIRRLSVAMSKPYIKKKYWRYFGW